MARANAKMGTCALCRKQGVALCQSHIIPEFLYNLPSDQAERNELRLWSSDRSKHPKKSPVGVYERLLCRPCEDRFRDLENYAAPLLDYTNDRLNAQAHIKGELYEISGVEYARMKLFLLSMLWRMGASNSEYFQNVQLGEHQEQLRLMLLNANPGLNTEYGCVISYCPLLRERFPAVDLRQLGVFPEDAGDVHGYPMIRMVFGGLFWQYHITKHATHPLVVQLQISGDGTMRIPKLGENAFHFIGRSVEDVFDWRNVSKDPQSGRHGD